MPRRIFEIHAAWDDEAQVWYVVESDVPGLAAEAPTAEALVEKLRTIVPELVALNRHKIDFDFDPAIPVHLMATCLTTQGALA